MKFQPPDGLPMTLTFKYYFNELKAMALGRYYHKKTLTDTTKEKGHNSYITKTLRKYVMVLGKPFHGSLNLNDRRLLDFDFRSRKRNHDFQGLQELLFFTYHLTKKLLACSGKCYIDIQTHNNVTRAIATRSYCFLRAQHGISNNIVTLKSFSLTIVVIF